MNNHCKQPIYNNYHQILWVIFIKLPCSLSIQKEKTFELQGPMVYIHTCMCMFYNTLYAHLCVYYIYIYTYIHTYIYMYISTYAYAAVWVGGLEVWEFMIFWTVYFWINKHYIKKTTDWKSGNLCFIWTFILHLTYTFIIHT